MIRSQQAVDAISFYARNSEQDVPGMMYGDYFAAPTPVSPFGVHEKGVGWQPTQFHGVDPAISSRQMGETLERLARLVVHHDDAATIYINGLLAVKLSGYQSRYTTVPLRPERILGRARSHSDNSAFRKGRSIVRQNYGGQNYSGQNYGESRPANVKVLQSTSSAKALT